MNITGLSFINDNGKISQVPEWCLFFADLGSFIGEKEKLKTKPGTRTVLGITVPTRAFASSFLATGIVLTRAASLGKKTVENHFKQLCSLEKGTRVLFKDGKRIKCGIFEGVDKVGNQPAIRVNLRDKHNTTHLFIPKRALDVTIAPDQNISISNRQVGRLVNTNREFIACLLENVTPAEFVASSRFECVIIGNVKWLQYEIENTVFAFNKPGRGVIKGTLQDVLRVRRFLRNSPNFKTDIWPVTKSLVEGIDSEENPAVIVFDGATSFLRWKDYCRGSHWVVLLDRTEPSYREAVEEFNNEYIQNRLGGVLKISVKSFPHGIELCAYKEACK